jgi:transposase
MAQQDSGIIIGIDVCKDRLDLFEHESGRGYSIGNDAPSIETWLDGQAGHLQVALEPTNRYHEAVAEAAYARGHDVYWIDPFRLSHYRAGLGRRAKTDPQDAYLLARFLAREVSELRPWTPLTQGQQRFWQLLKRRSTLVRAKVQLRQSLTDMGTLQDEVDSLLRHCVRMIAKLDRALLARAKELGWSESIARCRAIPGIGPLTAMALVATWHRGDFSNVDAFVAFLGLDVRIRQSARWQGRRKLTKKGDGEIRRLLFNAAMQARRNALWAPYYLRLRDRGLSSTAAFVALSRKLAKVCFALLQNNSEFDPLTHRAACMSS